MKSLRRFLSGVPILLVLISFILLLFLARSLFFNQNDAKRSEAPSENNKASQVVKDLSFENGEVWNVWRKDSPRYASRAIDLTTDKDYLDYTFICSGADAQLTKIGTVGNLAVNQCKELPKTSTVCHADKAETQVIPCVYDKQGNVRRVSFTLQGTSWIYPIALLYDKAVPDAYKSNVQKSHWVLAEIVETSNLEKDILKRRINQTNFYSFNCSDRPEYTTCAADGADKDYLYFKPNWATQFYVVRLIPNYFYQSAG